MRVAIVTESLWKMAGGSRVLSAFADIFPEADIYSLFGYTKEEDKKKFLSKSIYTHKIYYSKLNSIPFIKKIYRYTFPFWIKNIEIFNFSNYDLVISCSSSVAHGVVTPIKCKHISYIHTPMRYAWDLGDTYFNKENFSNFVRSISKNVMHNSRIWDVVASNRSDVLLCNSNYVKKRILKYWRKDVDDVIYPPVQMYKGDVESSNSNRINNRSNNKRDDYFVAGAPFEQNKGGDFLLDCASKIGFNLKVIGNGSMLNKLKRKYKCYKNIEFLGWVSDNYKYELLSNASGYIICGIEDYGIFVAEAISCGTPVLAYKDGGSLEIVKDGISGLFFDTYSIDVFRDRFNELCNKKWNYREIQKSLDNVNTEEEFIKKIKRWI